MFTVAVGWSAGTTYSGVLHSVVLTQVPNSAIWLRSAAAGDWSGSSGAVGVSGAVTQLSESQIVLVADCDARAVVSLLSAAASLLLRATLSQAPWKGISSNEWCARR